MGPLSYSSSSHALCRAGTPLLLRCRELLCIFPERWLPSLLRRAADMSQPSARQQALSILDLMVDCFEQEMLLGALEKSLARLRTSRAKAKAIEYGTSIVQGCPDLERTGSDGAPGTPLAPRLHSPGPTMPLAHRWNAPAPAPQLHCGGPFLGSCQCIR